MPGLSCRHDIREAGLTEAGCPKREVPGKAARLVNEYADVFQDAPPGRPPVQIIGQTIDTGDVFGSGALIGVGYRTYTAIAKTDCKLAFLDRRKFLFAVQETPIFALKVMKSYSERLSRLERLL